MLGPLTALLVFQLIGELVSRATGIPLPGPVIGMALLFGCLLVRGSVPDPLERLTDALLAHLSLLFVPAGVGVMLHVDLIAAQWVPITIALVASTLLTIAVTALVMRALSPIGADGAGGDGSRDARDDAS